MPMAIPSLFFREILAELKIHNWSLPIQGGISELGVAFGGHVGLKRSRNEDRMAVARIFNSNVEVYTLAIVCDGVGGSDAGDEAATLAVGSMISDPCFQRAGIPLGKMAENILKSADVLVRNQLGGRGSTTASLFIAKSTGECVAANVGDSRIYSWIPENLLEQVSIDDTVENELKNIPGNHDALLDARGLRGRLSQAIGEEGRGPEDLRIKAFGERYFPVGVVVGSDGLWKVSEDFGSVVFNATSANDAVRRSVALANWNGGVDNSSIIAIESVEKFSAAKEDLGKFEGFGATVWVGSTVLKFFDLGAKSSYGTNQKSEKTKAKMSRKRKINPNQMDSQLPLPEGSEDGILDRPVLEISVEKNKGE